MSLTKDDAIAIKKDLKRLEQLPGVRVVMFEGKECLILPSDTTLLSIDSPKFHDSTGESDYKPITDGLNFKQKCSNYNQYGETGNQN